MPLNNRETVNPQRSFLCIAALVFISIAVSSTPTGLVFVVCVACFGAAYATSAQLNQSASAFTFMIAMCGLFATCYFLWCCWVISSSPDYWPRPMPYPDTLIDWMHNRLNSRFVSPFGNKQLLAVFGGIAALSAGFTGWGTACLFGRMHTNLSNPLDSRTTAIYVRCAFGCAAGFFLGFFPAVIVGKSMAPVPILLPVSILAASTLLGGFVVSRHRGNPTESSPDNDSSVV